MAKITNEIREKAKQIFIESNGMIKPAEIADSLGVTSAQVRKWKCVGKWDEELKNQPKKRGGQKGNKNARGHGAPRRNRNAERHGAYSKVYFDELTPEEQALIESVTLNTEENTLRELQSLIAKEKDLEKRIKALNAEGASTLYIDKVVEMRTPKECEENEDPYGAYEEEKQGNKLGIAMETTIKSSAFERAMKLEAELNKIHGRIIKLLDTIKSYELEQRRIALEERRYALMKQKVSGEYNIDPDTGEIDDTYNEDETEE